MATVEGVAYWARVHTPDTTYDPQWCIDLVVDKKIAKGFNDKGVKVKQNDDGEYVVKFKRNVEKKNGGENKPPRIVDVGKKPLLDEIGNGSKVVVQYQTYDWKYKTKSGVGVDLMAVQVLELVEYKGANDADEFEEHEPAIEADAKDAPFDDDDGEF